jgi:hypothetical protein
MTEIGGVSPLKPEIWSRICTFLVNPAPRATTEIIPTVDDSGKKRYHQHALVQLMRVSKVSEP